MEVRKVDLQKRKRKKVAKRSRTYYCKTCQESITFQDNEIMKCNKCSALFGNNKRNPFEINMRTTWSGQTKVEFNETTIGESINRMNK